ncbi:hypothetical protein AGMMS49992_29530 [Clostridia bacterium]|nr:hypothetical protein AGMMS49992_29530 [Clostridia bacterium]
MTSYQKLPKKQQRELDPRRRGSWGNVKPVTQQPDRSDAYNRMKQKRRWQRETDASGIFAA